MTANSEVATLGGGCFWCLEAVYDELNGVIDVVSGYSGGSVPDPSYQAVCTGSTGHAEVVQLKFDPQVISYREILEVFFIIHDPTAQSAVRTWARISLRHLCHTPSEETARQVIMSAVGRVWSRPVVTELIDFTTFYPAEVPPGIFPPQPLCESARQSLRLSG
jgi:peptide-methionine (S)-S-oxide reductase